MTDLSNHDLRTAYDAIAAERRELRESLAASQRQCDALAAEVERQRLRIEELDYAVAYAPENAFHELTKDGIEFTEVDAAGEETEETRRIQFWEDRGDPSVGIDPSCGWTAEKPSAELAALRQDAERCREACREALSAIDDAYASTGHIKVAKTSRQRKKILAAIDAAKEATDGQD